MQDGMRTNRLPALILVATLSLAAAHCGSASAPTSPSPAPSPSPTPSPSPSPTPGAPNSLTLSPQTIQGQGQPQATVTLANAAPAGGALVTVTSDNPTAAKVPATVTVAGGARSSTFLIDTATVSVATNVRITAAYAGTSMSAILTVNPPTMVPSFVVRSRTRGAGACVVDAQTQELDCVLDGSASQGFVSAYLWTYTMGSITLRHTAAAPNAASSPQGVSCALYQQGTGGDDPNGDRYLRMEVTLQLRDGAGALSDIARQQIKVYPNRQCGFSY